MSGCFYSRVTEKMTKCERCGKEEHYLEQCMGCSKYACRACQKASKSASKIRRLIICKTCWTAIPKRRKWEQA